MHMKRKQYFNTISAIIIALIVCSCGGDDDGGYSPSPTPTPTQGSISVYATLNQFNSITLFDAPYENGDEISVFAITEAQRGVLLNQGNYADNVRYKYQNGQFVANGNAIKLNRSTSLAYYAIFPYRAQNCNDMTFSVRSDQSTLSGYKASDLRTAYIPATTNTALNFQFYHSLSQVCANIISDQVQSSDVSVKLYMQAQAQVNVTADTYPATGETIPISMYYDTTTKCHFAIVPPQVMSISNTFMTILYKGEEYPVEFYNDINFQSGAQYLLDINFKLESDGNYHAVVIKGQINPWNK